MIVIDALTAASKSRLVKPVDRIMIEELFDDHDFQEQITWFANHLSAKENSLENIGLALYSIHNTIHGCASILIINQDKRNHQNTFITRSPRISCQLKISPLYFRKMVGWMVIKNQKVDMLVKALTVESQAGAMAINKFIRAAPSHKKLQAAETIFRHERTSSTNPRRGSMVRERGLGVGVEAGGPPVRMQRGAEAAGIGTGMATPRPSGPPVSSLASICATEYTPEDRAQVELLTGAYGRQQAIERDFVSINAFCVCVTTSLHDYIQYIRTENHSFFHWHHKHSNSGRDRALHMYGRMGVIRSGRDGSNVDTRSKQVLTEIISFANKRGDYTRFSGSINANRNSMITYVMGGIQEYIKMLNRGGSGEPGEREVLRISTSKVINNFLQAFGRIDPVNLNSQAYRTRVATFLRTYRVPAPASVAAPA